RLRRRGRAGPVRDAEALARDDHAPEREAVGAGELHRAHAEVPGDLGESFTRAYRVDSDRRPCRSLLRLRALRMRERTERAGPCDPVRAQALRALESSQGSRSRRVEAPVDPLRSKAVAAQPELERRDVPPHAPAREHALPEERRPEPAELAARRHPDLAG